MDKLIDLLYLCKCMYKCKYKNLNKNSFSFEIKFLEPLAL